MGCCGQNRSAMSASQAATQRSREWPSNLPGPTALRTDPSLRGSASSAVAERNSNVAPALSRRAMSVRYVERNAVIVRGPASGTSYRFSAASPVQSVDVRDADSLLRSGLFMRA